ncbi:MAG: carboxypeptidase regulatory-like domain-containing protein, partial [Planctomycetota bacterium]
PPAPMPVAAETATKRASTNEPEQKTDEARIAAKPVDAVEPEPSPTEMWGRVVDAATKRPVRGASIDLVCRDADAFLNIDLAYGERKATLAHAKSDGDGRFRFDVARATPHRVIVQAAGFAPKTQVYCTGGSFVAIELTRGSVLTGVVRCDDQPVADANVRIAVRGESIELATATSDSSGAFRVAGLPPADVYVQVSSVRFQEKWASIRIDETAQQHVEIELQKGAILRGRVLDAATGAPIQGARVADSWRMKRAANTDGDGRFQLEGLQANGYLMCCVAADGYSSAQKNVGTTLDAEVELRLHRGGEVHGRVVDADGAVVQGAYVALCASYREVPGFQEADLVPAHLDANGRFVARGLRSNLHYWLMARAPGCGTRCYALARVLGNGEQLDLGDCVLRRTGFVEGVVTNDQGEPVKGTQVSIAGHNDDARSFLPEDAKVDEVPQFRSRSPKTDGRGRFRFASLAGGTYTVSVRPEGSYSAVEVEVQLEDGELREGIALVLPTGVALAGVVVAVDGKPFTDTAMLEAHIETEGDWARYRTNVGSDGSFRFASLKPGRYTLSMVVRPRGQVMAPVFHVEAGTTNLRIALELPMFVSGKVVDAAGEPVRANVYARLDGFLSGSGAVLSGADGSFRLEVAASFRGKVGAMLPEGGLMAAQVEDVVAGQTDLVLKLAPSPFQEGR